MVLVHWHDDELARVIEICTDTVGEHSEEGDVVLYVLVNTGTSGRPPTWPGAVILEGPTPIHCRNELFSGSKSEGKMSYNDMLS